mmetsp:Transcript_33434/g.72339  ORF Transcript_33434/g.72339 Transcript_33434/m.72339 type:complete len:317 (+) Transcript_33434:614-1564(+)
MLPPGLTIPSPPPSSLPVPVLVVPTGPSVLRRRVRRRLLLLWPLKRKGRDMRPPTMTTTMMTTTLTVLLLLARKVMVIRKAMARTTTTTTRTQGSSSQSPSVRPPKFKILHHPHPRHPLLKIVKPRLPTPSAAATSAAATSASSSDGRISRKSPVGSSTASSFSSSSAANDDDTGAATPQRSVGPTANDCHSSRRPSRDGRRPSERSAWHGRAVRGADSASSSASSWGCATHGNGNGWWHGWWWWWGLRSDVDAAATAAKVSAATAGAQVSAQGEFWAQARLLGRQGRRRRIVNLLFSSTVSGGKRYDPGNADDIS